MKHTDGRMERVPYFSLPAQKLTDVIAKSCYSCFDYPNYLADMTVGMMVLTLPQTLTITLTLTHTHVPHT